MEITADSMITRSFSEHCAFFLRNLTPRTVFANVVAFIWIIAMSWFLRWLSRLRDAAAARSKKILYAVKAIAGAGDGCVAVRNLAAGTCLIAERPVRADSMEALTAAIAGDLGRFDQLCRPADASDTAAGIVAQNAFLTSSGSAWLCQRASKLNHSCAPSCAVLDCDDGLIRVVTTQSISAGDELCICYSAAAFFQPNGVRAATLERLWNFRCACPRCAGTLGAEEASKWRVVEQAAAAADGAKPKAAASEPAVAALQRRALEALDSLSPLMPEAARLVADLEYFSGGGAEADSARSDASCRRPLTCELANGLPEGAELDTAGQRAAAAVQ